MTSPDRKDTSSNLRSCGRTVLGVPDVIHWFMDSTCLGKALVT